MRSMMSFDEFKASIMANAEGGINNTVSADEILTALFKLDNSETKLESFYEILQELGAPESAFQDLESAQVALSDATGTLQKALGIVPASEPLDENGWSTE